MRIPLQAIKLTLRDGSPTYKLLLPVLLICKYPMIEKMVTFLVDTGAMCTTLLDTDARRLGIQYRDLNRLPENEWVKGVGANPVETYRVEKVRLLLLSEDRSQTLWEKEIPNLAVLRHPKDVAESVRDMHSLLGMDVLCAFQLIFDGQNPDQSRLELLTL